MSFAKILVAGNLGRDPELRYLPDGRPVASFSICANKRRKNAAGERVEEQQWFQVSAFGNSAEACARHLTKGSQVFVEGTLQPELWTGRDGATRLTLNINSSDVQFMDSRRRDGDSAGDEGAQPGEGETAIEDDDIPF
jgi:single-strand DNA-binding protein